MTEEKRGIIFISCGQFTNEEKQLGTALVKLVDDLTAFEGYFAEDQSSLEGLSRNIFGALNRCCGFVGVMHHRGHVETPHGKHTRGSLWVEQEIAIAAFLQQAQNRDLAVAVYVQRPIKREGVREQLHLNPVDFDTNAEVVEDLKARIADGRFSPVRLSSPKEIEIRFDHQTITRTDGSRHQYRLQVFVKNTGHELLTDYWLELRFPKAALDMGKMHGALKQTETATHAFLRTTRELVGVDIYPDSEVPVLIVEYHVDRELYNDGSVLTEPVIGIVGSTGMLPKRIEQPFRELQEF
jgi:hypothetical protein